VTTADIDHVVPHQANIRIVEAACERLGLPMDKTINVLDRTGNTSAASIPLALVHALDHGWVHDGDLLLMVGFGAGMTWGSAVLRWEERS
jgi:3-oxoacyl-[acyl-carrier-protein] synthase III